MKDSWGRAAGLLALLGTLAFGSCVHEEPFYSPDTGTGLRFTAAVRNPSWTGAVTYSGEKASADGKRYMGCREIEGAADGQPLYLHEQEIDGITSTPASETPLTYGTPVNDAASLASTHGGFAVYGYSYVQGAFGSAFPDHPYNAKATPADNTGTSWSFPSGSHYFLPTSGMAKFYAVAPADLNSVPFFASDLAGAPSFTYTVPQVAAQGDNGATSSDATAQPDLLLAVSGEIDCGGSPKPDGTVALNFRHMLSAVQFKVGTDTRPGTIRKIVLHDIARTGTFTAPETDTKSNILTVDNWSVTEHGKITWDLQRDVTGGENLSADGNTFMLIPQTHQNNAAGTVSPYIEIVFDTDDEFGTKTKTLSLDGITWNPGKTYVYKITSSSIFEDRMFDVRLGAGTDASPYVVLEKDTTITLTRAGADIGLALRSYKTRSLPAEERHYSLAWTAEFRLSGTQDWQTWDELKTGTLNSGTYAYQAGSVGSVNDIFYQGGTTDNWCLRHLFGANGDPAFVSGDGSASADVWEDKTQSVAEQYNFARDYDYALKLNPVQGNAGAPLDLSMYDFRTGGSMAGNSANCYPIDAAGYYAIPLVYGNSMKDGTVGNIPNNASFSLGFYAGHSRFALQRGFITTAWKSDAYGDPDSSYAPLLDAANLEAELIWQDEQSMISDPAISADGKYLTFTVAGGAAENMKQFNALIGVKLTDSSNFVWSWHLWGTDMRSTLGFNYYLKLNGNNFGILPRALGAIEAAFSHYPSRTLEVRFKQENPATADVPSADQQTLYSPVIRIVQERFDAYTDGRSPYFQWGRKDPIRSIQSGNDYTDRTLYDVDNNVILTTNQTISDNANVNYLLSQYPTRFWIGNPLGETSYRWGIGAENTAAKTIYDPCPVYYQVPTSNNNTISSLLTISGNYPYYHEDVMLGVGYNYGLMRGIWQGSDSGLSNGCHVYLYDENDNLITLFISATGRRIASSGTIMNVDTSIQDGYSFNNHILLPTRTVNSAGANYIWIYRNADNTETRVPQASSVVNTNCGFTVVGVTENPVVGGGITS